MEETADLWDEVDDYLAQVETQEGEQTDGAMM